MKLSKTMQVILSQLQENTGRTMGDSGGAYGRNWERNQKATWESLTNEPVTTEAYVYTHGPKPELDLTATISLAYWMEANLVYDHRLQKCYDKFCRKHPGDYDMNLMQAFVKKSGRGNSTGSINSYNDECDLSQTIQFIQFDWGEYSEPYVLLQVHGGCDIRGGYTSPKAYKLRNESGYLMNWRVDSWGTLGQWWDVGGDPQDGDGPNLFRGYEVFDFKFENTLKADLEALKQTDHDNEETREKMKAQNILLEEEAFQEALEAYTIVVKDHKAYFEGDEIKGGYSGY